MTESKTRLFKKANSVGISILIPAKNEEDVISDCLESAKWAGEVIVMVNDSTDRTEEIVRSFPGVKCLSKSGGTFSSRKNELLKKAKNDWLFYLDADERITPLLRQEILSATSDPMAIKTYAVPRRNFLLGKELQWGGWGQGDSYVIRLFHKSTLKGFEGDLHETPVFEGDLGKLTEPLIHLQPETIEPALAKSISWSSIEAELLAKANHPPVTWWRVLRMGATTLFERLVKKQGLNDGIEGWIEAVYQTYHTMIVYLRLWEIQL